MYSKPGQKCGRLADVSKTHATLLERIRDGSDPVAWEDFFARYWRLIFFFARRRGCSEHTAEEVVQEVMTTVFQKRDVFCYDPACGRFRDWLAVVVGNQVAAHRRKASERIRARGDNGEEEGITCQSDTKAAADAVWEEAFETSLLSAMLDVVRRQVEPRTFQAFELTALGELSAAQASAVTGLSRNAVYQARRAVLRRLADLGTAYRDGGQLDARIKKALEMQPETTVWRSLTRRMTSL